MQTRIQSSWRSPSRHRSSLHSPREKREDSKGPWHLFHARRRKLYLLISNNVRRIVHPRLHSRQRQSSRNATSDFILRFILFHGVFLSDCTLAGSDGKHGGWNAGEMLSQHEARYVFRPTVSVETRNIHLAGLCSKLIFSNLTQACPYTRASTKQVYLP